MKTSASMLRMAQALLVTRTVDLNVCWPRVVALLGRQALETALDDFWRTNAPGVLHASRTAQLLCLEGYLEDREVARATRHAWHALSRACHHHVYELPPTASELQVLLHSIQDLLMNIASPEPPHR